MQAVVIEKIEAHADKTCHDGMQSSSVLAVAERLLETYVVSNALYRLSNEERILRQKLFLELTVDDCNTFGYQGSFPDVCLANLRWLRNAFTFTSKGDDDDNDQKQKNQMDRRERISKESRTWGWKIKLAVLSARVAWVEILLAAAKDDNECLRTVCWRETWINAWIALQSIDVDEQQNSDIHEHKCGTPEQINLFLLPEQQIAVLHLVGVMIGSLCRSGKRFHSVEKRNKALQDKTPCVKIENAEEQAERVSISVFVRETTFEHLMEAAQGFAREQERTLRTLYVSDGPSTIRLMLHRAKPVYDRIKYASLCLSTALVAMLLGLLLVVIPILLFFLVPLLKKHEAKQKTDIEKAAISSSTVQARTPIPSTLSVSSNAPYHAPLDKLSPARSEHTAEHERSSVRFVDGEDTNAYSEAQGAEDLKGTKTAGRKRGYQIQIGISDSQAEFAVMAGMVLGVFMAISWSCASVETSLGICTHSKSPFLILGRAIRSWFQWLSLATSILFLMVSLCNLFGGSAGRVSSVKVGRQIVTCLIAESSAKGWLGRNGSGGYLGIAAFYCWLIAVVDPTQTAYGLPVWLIIFQTYLLFGNMVVAGCWVHRCMRFGYPLHEISLGLSGILSNDYLKDIWLDSDLVVWYALSIFGTVPVAFAYDKDPALGLWAVWLFIMMMFPAGETPMTEEQLSRHELCDVFIGDCAVQHHKKAERLATYMITGFVSCEDDNALKGDKQNGGLLHAVDRPVGAYTPLLHSALVANVSTATFWTWICGQLCNHQPGQKRIVIA